MKAEIIAVGTELLLGQIVNSNAQYLSTQLAELGIHVYFHTVVGDNAGRLRETIQTSQNRSDLVILTGGLGPTRDDITKETVADILGKKQVIDQQALEKIESYFRHRQLPMSSNNRKQAEVIEGSRVFPNDYGMAPGMAVEEENRHYVLLPGPPSELKPMFEQYVRPYLQSLMPDSYTVFSRTLRFFGIGESRLDEKLSDLIQNQSNPTIAPLAKEYEVTIRLTARAASRDEANRMISGIEQEIRNRTGRFIYGQDDESLQQVVVRMLKERGKSVAVAESCTGGMIAEMITSVAGSSQVFPGSIVSYSNGIKQTALHIPEQVIRKYGAVSEQTARLMSENIRGIMDTEYGVSVTGVAGPDRQEEKEVGTVYIGLSNSENTRVFPLKLAGHRHAIRLQAAKYALYYLWQSMKEG
ncbi:MAG: competence/damage-inducible protein A [Bacillaceae bacterium]|nr:competence/damage-inducible protein A [Bacillaceae bacterium]